MLLGDSRLVDLFSVGPILEGIGLNVTAWSYQDRMNFSLLSCPDLVPDLAPLVAELGPRSGGADEGPQRTEHHPTRLAGEPRPASRGVA